MNPHHTVSDLHIKAEKLIITIDGQVCEFQLSEVSSRLAAANDQQRNTFDISPSGYGIHWPLIDEDLSVDGLLGIKHQASAAMEEDV